MNTVEQIAERVAGGYLVGEPVKIRKTVPMNTTTRVHRDTTKWHKTQRQRTKHDLRKYEGIARRMTARLLDTLDPKNLPSVWYETEDGRRWEPPVDTAWPGIPDGFVYQHSRFPRVLRHEILRVKPDGTSEQVMAFESSWAEDLALGLVRKGLTLSEAILVSATACERCMNVLAYECGLDWGYAEGSEEYEKAHTECELCHGEQP